MTDSVKRAGDVNVNLAQATWRKSSYSGGSGNCVEIAGKNPSGPALVFTPRAWRAFVAGVKNGDFDQR